MAVAILLRNGKHKSTDSNEEATIRYGLKCDSVAIQIARSPLQIPIPESSPEILDLGISRPSITIGGLIDTVGLASHTTANFENMESFSVTRKYWNSTTYEDSTQTYYIPYKNKLESFVLETLGTFDAGLELEIGNANYPLYNTAAEAQTGTTTVSDTTNSETGGSVYTVAIQQCRFQQDPAQEDRYTFQMQLIASARKDIMFT
tara:strand:+ start:1064 stop:1675 length:612 start_codon:yes stop_codon:yes gene_type:complete